MTTQLDSLFERSFFSKLDYHFAQSITSLVDETSSLVQLGAATASYYNRLGHVCAPLRDLAGTPIVTPDGEPIEGQLWPEKDIWQNALQQSPVVSNGHVRSPLVLNDDRLYLFRYWQYEANLAQDLIQRGQAITGERPFGSTQKFMDLLFPPKQKEIRQQRQAAIQAINNRLTVISGGPGTGKTTTVLRILAVILAQLSAANKHQGQILLMAPTGKAAARLSESIRLAKARLRDIPNPLLQETLQNIPDKAKTIHRALIPRYDNPTRFVHTRENPLATDIVVVDEASMIDMALMAKLLEAVPVEGRLLLLGDKNQLSSVEAGSIFGDICDAWQPPSPRVPGSQCVVQLQHSFRFDAQKGIGRLSAAINQGNFQDLFAAFEEDGGAEIQLIDCPTESALKTQIEQIALTRYQAYLDAPNPVASLEAFERLRILCAHKRGLFSVQHLNEVIEHTLREKKLLDPKSEWYQGRPILVTRNDAQLGLWNGDLGIVLPRGDHSGDLAAYFQDEDLQYRRFSLSRLPVCETVFAMTVHKAQGSEYDEVFIVLPEHPSPILTRELLYTAVTRARQRVTILSTKRILEHATRNTVRRTSGLQQRLREGGADQLSFGFI